MTGSHSEHGGDTCCQPEHNEHGAPYTDAARADRGDEKEKPHKKRDKCGYPSNDLHSRSFKCRCDPRTDAEYTFGRRGARTPGTRAARI